MSQLSNKVVEAMEGHQPFEGHGGGEAGDAGCQCGEEFGLKYGYTWEGWRKHIADVLTPIIQPAESDALVAAAYRAAAIECERHADFCKREALNGGDVIHLLAHMEEARYNAERILALTPADAQRQLDRIVAEKVAEAKLEGSLDVLWQIRSFRKQHPMDNGMDDTIEFIGNLYYQYDKAVAAARAKQEELR